LLAFLDIDLEDKTITLCGNYGDPIYHTDLIRMISKLKDRGAMIKIVTNGSYKSKHWWQDLCLVLDTKDEIIFSIDGSPENFMQYRINADWYSIQTGIEVCVANEIHTVWKFIAFRFNQDSIDDARHMAKSLGVHDFFVNPSDRFDEKTIDFIPRLDLLGARKASQDLMKQGFGNEIDPECHRGRAYYISADGFFSPCCYVSDHRFYYKTQFGKQRGEYDIKNTTFSQIMTDQKMREFYQTLHSTRLGVCQYNCPKT